MYFTYVLRCQDRSLYTGITTDVARRMREHQSRAGRCAKYTMRHELMQLEAVWQSADRAAASRLEYRIKRLTRQQKEQLLSRNNLEQLMGDKLDAAQYVRVPVPDWKEEAHAER
ncbi:MAG: GIY-YIG nuclease family protein [Butyricicoccus sp.]